MASNLSGRNFDDESFPFVFSDGAIHDMLSAFSLTLFKCCWKINMPERLNTSYVRYSSHKINGNKTIKSKAGMGQMVVWYLI